ncbi:MAG: shikimate kinase [Gammaproteobacteria bacterium]|nr:MAG: shikimate kinase [Gammaproteobacteria bacterium]
MLENITLIGMPGAGKSTVGHLLAKCLQFEFIDTDKLICQQQKRTLQSIVNEDGYMQLRRFEEQAILSIDAKKAVIATGGSVVYSETAMQHLSRLSRIIYLSVPYEIIEDRIKNLDTRGLVKQAHQSLHELYVERTALYEKYAEIIVDATLSAEAVAEKIEAFTTEDTEDTEV